MIAYPLNIPAAANTRESNCILIAASVVGVNQSPYNYSTQVYDYGAEAWGLKVSVNPLTREEAQPWIAFLTALRGRRGTFLFGPAIMGSPSGTGEGVPVVSIGGETGNELSTSGWQPNQIVLKAGDLFEVDQRLYMNLTNALSDADGACVLDIFPKAKKHEENSALILNNPRGTFRLTNNVVPVLDAAETGLFNINFEAEEA